ncbi:glycosyltransferase, partial [Arthrobacter sp. MYb222]|uniref:glycosyltransferase n=1 Tax=Arthrobacter sp. MYb222 TaxID=1848599 RepID=UPI0011B05B2F
MSKAIQTLERIGKGRQLHHYRSEYAIFSGQEPSVTSTLYKAEESNRQVLYLATNSLPHTGSGYAQRTQSLLSALQSIGWTVKAATRVNYPLNIGKIRASRVDVVDGIEYERFLPFPARSDFVGRVQQQAEELLEKVAREKPNILHTTTDFSNALAIKAVSEATGIPWVYEVRGQLADTWLSTRPVHAKQSERYQRFVEREAYVASHASHVFTLGEEMYSNLITTGVEPTKITLLPNGIGENFLNEPVSKFAARQELGLEKNAFYVGTVSSLVPYEGLATVINAAARISDDNPNLRLLIVGDGTERENLMRLVRDLGIEDICTFPGRVPREKANLYHSSLNTFV